MGTWLAALHVRTANREAILQAAEIAAARHKCRFRVGPPKKGWIALPADFGPSVREAATDIAVAVGAPMFCFHVADDDDFEYQFFRDGRLADQYRARPNAFDPVPRIERPAWRGRPETFADLLGSDAKVEECRRVLHRKRPVFESERLEQFAHLLGIPHALHAYSDFEMDADTIPSVRRFVHVPDDAPARTQARREAARRRVEAKRFRTEGVLLAELRPPTEVLRPKNGFVSLSWAVEPAGSLLARWEYGFFPDRSSVHERWASPWDAPTPMGEPLPPGATPVVFSPDGSRAVVRIEAREMTAEIWDWPPTHRLAALPLDQFLKSSGFSHDGRAIYLLDAQALSVFSAEDGAIRSRLPGNPLPATIAVHPDGRYLVVGDHDGRLRIVDADSLRSLQGHTPFYRPPHQPGDPDFSAWFAAQVNASGSAGSTSLAELVRQAHPEMLYALRFSSDGRWLATATDRGCGVFAWNDVLLREVPSPRFFCAARPRPASHPGVAGCYALAFDERRGLILFGGIEGVVEFIELKTGRSGELLRPPESNTLRRLEITPNGDALAVDSHRVTIDARRPPELRLWNYAALCQAAGIDG